MAETYISSTLVASKNNFLNALSATSKEKIPWIIDSGASDHMTDAYYLFTSYLPCAGNLKVKIADGSFSSVAGKGSIKLSESITLESVLHVPKLSCNLLSISKLTKNSNCYAKFLPSYCVFQDVSSGKTIGSAKECEGLYYFDETNITQAEVKFFFESCCGVVSRLRLLGDNTHSTRIAFVEFVMAESAIATLDCSGKLFGAQPIRVSPSKTPVRPRVLRHPQN